MSIIMNYNQWITNRTHADDVDTFMQQVLDTTASLDIITDIGVDLIAFAGAMGDFLKRLEALEAKGAKKAPKAKVKKEAKQ